MGNSPQFLDVFFGIQKIGMYINTVNTALRGDGLAFIIDNSDTKYLVVDHDLIDLYRSVADRDAKDQDRHREHPGGTRRVQSP